MTTDFATQIPYSKIADHRRVVSDVNVNAQLLANLISGLITSGDLAGSAYILDVVERRARELAQLSATADGSAWGLTA